MKIIKRIIVLITFASNTLALVSSCSTTQQAVSGNQSLNKGQVKGNWILNDVTFDGILPSSVRSLFGEDSYKCFIGSKWYLPNNGNGTYTLGNGCAGKTQNIVWSINKNDQTFRFKKLNEGDKAKDVTVGYVLNLSEVSNTEMEIKCPVEAGNSIGHIILHFGKNPD